MSKKAARQQKGKRKSQSRKSQPTWLLPLAGIGLVVILIAVFLIFRGGGAGLAPEISVAEAAAKRDEGAFVLDVREPDEWNQFHIPGATLIPLGQLANRVSELPGDQEIVVVCRSGNRSQEGRDILVDAGFEQVASMAGGMNDWAAAGYPTVSGP